METICLKLPCQQSFYITTNCDKLIALLYLQYGKYCTSCCKPKTEHHISIVKKDFSYIFSSPKASFITDTPLSEIDRYIFIHTKYHPDFFALHGAAIEWEEKGNILLAPTTSGKTTLTSYLLKHGFGYLTDDCVLLKRSDFHIHPYVTPLKLRDGGVEVLKEYNSLPNDLCILEEPPSLKRFVYTPQKCIEYSIPLKSIYFIQRSENQNAIITMSTTEKMTELIKSPITDYTLNGDYLRFISRLAKIDCYRLLYSDMSFVKEIIQNG